MQVAKTTSYPVMCPLSRFVALHDDNQPVLQTGRLDALSISATCYAIRQHVVPKKLKNYRPISNLTFMSKIIGRRVSRQLVTYLNDYNFLPTLQSAYTRFHSTATSILKSLTSINDQLHHAMLTSQITNTFTNSPLHKMLITLRIACID